MGTRRWSVLFVAGAMAWGAAGCGGGDDPKPGGFSLGTASPEAVTSGTTSPSPTSTKDADGEYVLPGGGYDVLANMPPEAKERSRKGVMAFTKYYFVALSKVQQKPVAGQLPLICTPECEDCIAAERGAQQRVAGQLHYDGQLYQVQGAGGEPTPDPDIETAESVRQIAMVNMKRVNVIDSQGRRVGYVGEQRQLLGQFRVVWRDGGWRMAKVDGNAVVPSK